MKNKPNIFVVILDTLRKDYAASLEDILKREGFLIYENVISPSSWTTPSHASMFTGMYPLYHKAHETKIKKGFKVRLLDTSNIITYILKNVGYKTYLFSANPHITPLFGFKGFDFVYLPDIIPPSIFQEDDLKILSDIIKNRKIEKIWDIPKVLMEEKKYLLFLKLGTKGFIKIPYLYTTNIMRNWPIEKGASSIIKELRKTPLKKVSNFVFINFIEAHEPYYQNYLFQTAGNLTGKVNSKTIQEYQKRYPKSAQYVIKKTVELIETLKEKKLYEDSLIIITSDHGQLLGEHERIGHGTFLYDELLRVPLMVKYPSKTEIKIEDISGKYISLTKLNKLLLETATNNIFGDSFLYSNWVIAESFGIHDSLAFSNFENKAVWEKYRIAIYYQGVKALFNITDWRFEMVTPNNLDLKIKADLKRRLKTIILQYLDTKISCSKKGDRIE